MIIPVNVVILVVKCKSSEMMTLLLVRLDTKKQVSIRCAVHGSAFIIDLETAFPTLSPPQSLLHSKELTAV